MFGAKEAENLRQNIFVNLKVPFSDTILVTI